MGQLQIRIPQVRHLDFYPRSLERGCRSEKALKLAIAEMYVMGVSTRKVTEITEQLCGTEISASQVSRISKLLDDELEQFRNRPLGSYPVVYLDAHYEKVRRQGSIQDVAVLKATGVNCWGKREVIGVSCRLSEAEVHWREFLQQLQKRGLEGVQLIVSDDHSILGYGKTTYSTRSAPTRQSNFTGMAARLQHAGVPGSSVSFQTPSPHYDSSPLSSRRFTKTG